MGPLQTGRLNWGGPAKFVTMQKVGSFLGNLRLSTCLCLVIDTNLSWWTWIIFSTFHQQSPIVTAPTSLGAQICRIGQNCTE